MTYPTGKWKISEAVAIRAGILTNSSRFLCFFSVLFLSFSVAVAVAAAVVVATATAAFRHPSGIRPASVVPMKTAGARGSVVRP